MLLLAMLAGAPALALRGFGGVADSAPKEDSAPPREQDDLPVTGALLPTVAVPDSLAAKAEAWTAFSVGLQQELAREFAAALTSYERAARAAPDEPAILVRQAVCILEMRQPERALRVAERALSGDSLQPEAHWVRGACFVALGRYEEAAAALQRSTELRRDRRTLHALANVYERLGRFEEMIPPLTELIAEAPSLLRFREQRAKVYLRLGRAEDALADYQAILESDPDYPGARDRAEGLLEGTEQDEARIRFYAALVERHPLRDDLRWKLIRALTSAERWAEADSMLSRLHARDPRDPLPVLQLGLNAYRRGELEAAFDMIEQAERLGPTLPAVQRWKMRLYFAEGQLDSALACATRVTRLMPRLAAAWRIRAFALLDLDREEEALAAMRAWSEALPHDPEPLLLASGVLRRQERWEEGLETMRAAVDRSPADLELQLELVTFLDATAAYEEAEQILRAILAEHPDHAAALNALGYLLLERGIALSEAEQLIRRSLAIDPENPATLDSMGWLWYKKGDLGAAEEWLNRAIRGGGLHPEIYGHLARVQVARERPEKALATVREGLEHNPDNRMLRDLRRTLEAAEGPSWPEDES